MGILSFQSDSITLSWFLQFANHPFGGTRCLEYFSTRDRWVGNIVFMSVDLSRVAFFPTRTEWLLMWFGWLLYSTIFGKSACGAWTRVGGGIHSYARYHKPGVDGLVYLFFMDTNGYAFHHRVELKNDRIRGDRPQQPVTVGGEWSRILRAYNGVDQVLGGYYEYYYSYSYSN